MNGGIVVLPAGADFNHHHILRAADHAKPLIVGTSGFITPYEYDIETMTRSGTITTQFLDLLEKIPTSYLVVENHLIAHPAVLEAAVVGVPDERWQERPLAAVVLNEGAEATPAQLREFLADKVVRWWLPERWTFVDEVPRTSVGKYDKKTIRARHADGAYEVIESRD